MKKFSQKTSTRVAEALLIAAALGLISYFHYYNPRLDFVSSGSMHILLRRLYYIPILYAAFRFGLKGGLLASLTATAFFAPHAAMSMGGLFGGGSIDNFFDLVLYNVVAFTTGMVVEAKRRQGQRYQEVLKLNKEIEDRETALRRIKNYVESVLSSVSCGVVSCDRRGRVVTVNPAARRLLVQSEEELVAFPLERVFAGHEELIRAARLVLSAQQQRATLETELATAEGQSLNVSVRVTPHRSRSRTVGIVITLEDLTEVKNLTEQLQRAEKLSSLGELVAGVAHEVRNPLAVIKASVQMMEQEMEDSCLSTELARVMIQEIDRLDGVVRALLDFGRPSESQFGTVDPQRVLEEVILLTTQFAKQQLVQVTPAFSKRLPEIWADEDRLKQVFVNLISNAIQAMPDGGSLTIAAASQDGYLKISFSDTGIGIPAAERELIFNPFHTSRADGSGLGLAIVHRILDAHNGFISVDSQVGVGSTFTVGLPLAIDRAMVEESVDA